MFSHSWIHSAIFVLFACSITVLSQVTPPTRDSTNKGTPTIKQDAPTGSPTPKNPPVGKPPVANVPKPPTASGRTIVCTTGWSPVDGKQKKKPANTANPAKPSSAPGAVGKNSKTNSANGPRRRATPPAAPKDDQEHMSLCDTIKERYQCPTSTCKVKGNTKLPQASECKGTQKEALCVAYRPGQPNGQISLEKHTPHPETANGWIECAAVHKVDKKAGPQQKIDTIACHKLNVPMECSGCTEMKNAKETKTGTARKAEPANKTGPNKSQASGKPKTNGEKPQNKAQDATKVKPAAADDKTASTPKPKPSGKSTPPTTNAPASR